MSTSPAGPRHARASAHRPPLRPGPGCARPPPPIPRIAARPVHPPAALVLWGGTVCVRVAEGGLRVMGAPWRERLCGTLRCAAVAALPGPRLWAISGARGRRHDWSCGGSRGTGSLQGARRRRSGGLAAASTSAPLPPDRIRGPAAGMLWICAKILLSCPGEQAPSWLISDRRRGPERAQRLRPKTLFRLVRPGAALPPRPGRSSEKEPPAWARTASRPHRFVRPADDRRLASPIPEPSVPSRRRHRDRREAAGAACARARLLARDCHFWPGGLGSGAALDLSRDSFCEIIRFRGLVQSALH